MLAHEGRAAAGKLFIDEGIGDRLPACVHRLIGSGNAVEGERLAARRVRIPTRKPIADARGIARLFKLRKLIMRRSAADLVYDLRLPEPVNQIIAIAALREVIAVFFIPSCERERAEDEGIGNRHRIGIGDRLIVLALVCGNGDERAVFTVCAEIKALLADRQGVPVARKGVELRVVIGLPFHRLPFFRLPRFVRRLIGVVEEGPIRPREVRAEAARTVVLGNDAHLRSRSAAVRGEGAFRKAERLRRIFIVADLAERFVREMLVTLIGVVVYVAEARTDARADERPKEGAIAAVRHQHSAPDLFAALKMEAVCKHAAAVIGAADGGIGEIARNAADARPRRDRARVVHVGDGFEVALVRFLIVGSESDDAARAARTVIFGDCGGIRRGKVDIIVLARVLARRVFNARPRRGHSARIERRIDGARADRSADKSADVRVYGFRIHAAICRMHRGVKSRRRRHRARIEGVRERGIRCRVIVERMQDTHNAADGVTPRNIARIVPARQAHGYAVADDPAEADPLYVAEFFRFRPVWLRGKRRRLVVEARRIGDRACVHDVGNDILRFALVRDEVSADDTADVMPARRHRRLVINRGDRSIHRIPDKPADVRIAVHRARQREVGNRRPHRVAEETRAEERFVAVYPSERAARSLRCFLCLLILRFRNLLFVDCKPDRLPVAVKRTRKRRAVIRKTVGIAVRNGLGKRCRDFLILCCGSYVFAARSADNALEARQIRRQKEVISLVIFRSVRNFRAAIGMRVVILVGNRVGIILALAADGRAARTHGGRFEDIEIAQFPDLEGICRRADAAREQVLPHGIERNGILHIARRRFRGFMLDADNAVDHRIPIIGAELLLICKLRGCVRTARQAPTRK